MQKEFNFLFNLARFNAIMARRLSGHGLDMSDFIILYHLSSAPDGRLKRIELAHKLGLTASGVTRMLLPLEKLGIVARDLNKDDARARYATLTPAGSELLRDATASLEMKLEDIIPAGSEQKLDELNALLETMTDNLLQGEYAHEARARWGNTEAYKQSQERVKKMGKEGLERYKQESDQLIREIVAVMSEASDSPAVQTLIARHYDSLRAFYEPNLELYRGLADMYVSDPRFTATFDKYAVGLASFMRDAMTAFCESQKNK